MPINHDAVADALRERTRLMEQLRALEAEFRVLDPDFLSAASPLSIEDIRHHCEMTAR